MPPQHLANGRLVNLPGAPQARQTGRGHAGSADGGAGRAIGRWWSCLEGQGLGAAVDLGATAGVEGRDRGTRQRVVRGEQPAESLAVVESAVEQDGQRPRQALDDLGAVDEGGGDRPLAAWPGEGDELAVTEELLHPTDREVESRCYLGE